MTALPESNHPQPDLLDQALDGKFDYEASLQTGSPSANYFWYRKRRQTARLLRRHLSELAALAAARAEPPLCLDLGTGEAIDLFLIREQLGAAGLDFRYLAVDGNPTGLEVARRRARWLARRGDPDAADAGATAVAFEQLDFNQPLPLPAASVALLHCSEVIEHLPQVDPFLAELARVLVPGGLLLLTTPNEPNPLQKSWWTPAGRRRFRAHQQHLRRNPHWVTIDGRQLPIHDHIACQPGRAWDKQLARHGLQLLEAGRGAMVYGGNRWHDREAILGLRLLSEALLDTLPIALSRPFSAGHIALYQRRQP